MNLVPAVLQNIGAFKWYLGMLSHINDWIEYAGMALDVILMVRILALRLRKVYLFITLYVLLGLFYDGVELFMHDKSAEWGRIVIFSKFIYAVVYPLAVWDLFEEAKSTVEKVRKLAMSRMMTSLLFISLWGVLISAFTGSDDEPQSQYLMRLSVIIWTGSVAAVLAFLWVMRRGIKINSWTLPWNTAIWFRYFQIILVIEALQCIVLFSVEIAHDSLPGWTEPIGTISDLVLGSSAILLTAWCVYKLRAVPSDEANVHVDVKG